MTEEDKDASSFWENKTFIIAVVVVVVVIVFMYFNDRKQQQVYELQRLEQRVELLEGWGRSR